MDGDFRSEICSEILKECDIVITNPPFSLFREFVDWINKEQKQFLIIGSQNAFTYKEIFPLFKECKMWTGYNKVKIFKQPDGTTKTFGNICWFTNLSVSKDDEIPLTKTYNPKDYPKYDNFDAIEVSRVANIPKDYDGIMGVPITFLDKYHPQFEIVGMDDPDSEWRGRGPDLNGKTLYRRVLIKRKDPQFEIIDMNPHFFTITEQGLPKPDQLHLKNVGRKDPYARVLIKRREAKANE